MPRKIEMPRAKIFLAILLCSILAACATAHVNNSATPSSVATDAPPTARAISPTNTIAAPTARATLPNITLTPTARAAQTAQPTPTRAEIVTPTASDLRAIQDALDTIARAYTTGDAALLDDAVEKNTAFARMVRSDFAEYQKSFVGGQLKFAYRLLSAQARPYGFVQVHLVNQNGMVSDWFFREQDGKWILSEPTLAQLGAPQITETDNFIFKTYPWADDSNAAIMQLMENARARVEKVLGQVPDTKANVEIRPAYAVSPFDDPFAVAAYSANGRGARDDIWIYSPASFEFGAYDPTDGWESYLETILTHEYTHLVHKRVFNRAGQQCAWTSEGLAEFVAGSFRENAVRRAVATGNIIPLVDTETAVYKQDLNHMTLLKQDKGLAYGFAASLVKFITERFGGMPAFWKLADACDKNLEFDDALQQAFGMSLDEFDRAWRDWLKSY